MNIIAEIANMDPTGWIAPLGGTAGVMLVLKYFMGKNDANFATLTSACRAVETSNNRQTRALLALTLALDHGAAARREVGVITAELEQSERDRTRERDGGNAK